MDNDRTIEQIIESQAAKVIASGVLGRSKTYRRLFDYLVENSLAGRAPKELEIATDVFAKSADFDPTQDSMVRVYAHNLRQKLRQFYDRAGADEADRIYIPRGEYRLAVEPKEPAVETAPTPARDAKRVWLAAAVVALAFVGGWLAGRLSELPAVTGAAETPLWRAIADDDLPILVVVGDYFILGELDERGDVVRFVREFTVNSPADLASFRARHPDLERRYQNLNTTYLAQSTATALGDVLRVLGSIARDERRIEVVTMSEFDPGDVRTNHVVYVGYISALDKLLDFVFDGSSLAIGETFDELWNIDSGEVFTSNAGRPADYRNYRDYGYFSTFPGPAGNQFVVIAGTRDEGVLHSAQAATDPLYIETAIAAIPRADEGQFELLYEVTGFDRTHIDAMIVHAASIDASRIWRGQLTHANGGR